MNEIEQLFGQPSNPPEAENWLSAPNLVLVSLTLGILIIFLLLSIGHLVDLPKNNLVNLPTTVDPVKSKKEDVLNQEKNRPDLPKCPSPPQPLENTEAKKTVPQTMPVATTIYKALLEEFNHDLPRWSADINPLSLTVNFRNPKISFAVGRSLLPSPYENILADFFPRYLQVLQKFTNSIEAISIEGYTSSEWTSSGSIDGAYLNNMTLSHERTRAVLEYCLQLPTITPYKDWLRKILTANGLSSSRVIIENGTEVPEFSRRVEFRILIK
jgi:outer membrane protein OmpA-like peptidoglycan-associated protein